MKKTPPDFDGLVGSIFAIFALFGVNLGVNTKLPIHICNFLSKVLT